MCFMRKELQIVYLSNTLREKGLYLEFFQIPRISLYSVRMQENKDHKNTKYGHFSRSDIAKKKQWYDFFNHPNVDVLTEEHR